MAERLAREFAEVEVHHLDLKGHGRALNAVWSASDAQVPAYLDVDLSTDLAALAPLVAPLISGHSDVAIGSRLARGARVVRGVLPLVEDTGWFFETELLVLAQRAGLRIHEVPVDWVDDPDSSVDIVATATADLKGVARLLRSVPKGTLPIGVSAPGVPPRLATQLVRFAAIGVGSTLAYLVLFLVLRLGTGAQLANFLALGVTAIANTPPTAGSPSACAARRARDGTSSRA